jgi:hypothetical protein
MNYCKGCILLVFFLSSISLQAQQSDCILKDPPVFHMHFGHGQVKDVNASPPPNYTRADGDCPRDGEYTYSSSTPGCNNGDWFVLNEDHTPGDSEGNMMLVNAYPGGGVFLQYPITGLKENTSYEFALWLINVCRLYICCSNLSPNILVDLRTVSGKSIAKFLVNSLGQTETAQWVRQKAFFTMPAGETQLIMTMEDITIGGCGNDFALDDITLRECIKPEPPVTQKPKDLPPTVAKTQAPKVKKPAKKEVPEINNQPSVQKTTITTEEKETSQPTVTIANVQAPIPLVLRTRENPLVRQIQIPAGEIKIDLYDNGEIDGDTVTIYHNNELVVSKARLSQKPVTIQIKLDKSHPHHELVMVADNLGSIPPNTSLMIVTAKDKRYEVFISSTEQKNARVNIDLKE